MGELVFQEFYLVLELVEGGHEELIDIIQNYYYFTVGQLFYESIVEGEVKVGNLIELISEHIFVFDAEKIDEMVNVKDLSLEEVCSSFNGEGSFSYPWLSVEEEGVVLVIL